MKDGEFFRLVGKGVVKRARPDPRKIEMEGHKVTVKEDVPHRRIVEIKMIYFGAVSGAKFTATIKLDCDATDKDKWEVLTINYYDDMKVRFGASTDTRIKEYIKLLNR